MADSMNPQPPADLPLRRAALVAGFGLLLMAVLAPFAFLGVLQTLVVPADGAATVHNLAASAGLFRSSIAAFPMTKPSIDLDRGRE